MEDVAEGLTTTGPGSLADARLGRIAGSAGTYLLANIQASGIEGPDDLAVWWIGGDVEGNARAGHRHRRSGQRVQRLGLRG